jgi:hypothetical protein
MWKDVEVTGKKLSGSGSRLIDPRRHAAPLNLALVIQKLLFGVMDSCWWNQPRRWPRMFRI